MAGINETLLQTQAQVTFDKNSTYATATYIGTASAIYSLASANKKGDSYNIAGVLSGTVDSSRMTYIEAGRAQWTVTVKKGDSSSSGENPLTTTWNSTMAQYSYPLEKFLIAKEVTALKKWEELDPNIEEQADMLSTFQYYSDDAGTTAYLSAIQRNGESVVATVAKLKLNGTEEVLRYYPQVTRTNVYNSFHTFSSRKALVSHIDDEPNEQFTGYNVNWLKTAFDWSENSDGTWTLTESWIGAPTGDGGGWNEKLYGTNGWKLIALSAI